MDREQKLQEAMAVFVHRLRREGQLIDEPRIRELCLVAGFDNPDHDAAEVESALRTKKWTGREYATMDFTRCRSTPPNLRERILDFAGHEIGADSLRILDRSSIPGVVQGELVWLSFERDEGVWLTELSSEFEVPIWDGIVTSVDPYKFLLRDELEL
jgi:hypothetical protein